MIAPGIAHVGQDIGELLMFMKLWGGIIGGTPATSFPSTLIGPINPLSATAADAAEVVGGGDKVLALFIQHVFSASVASSHPPAAGVP